MTRPTKYNVSQAELEEYGVPIRVYTRRRNSGWTHERALQPPDLTYCRSSATRADCRYVATGTLYSVADHIAIRQLTRDGMSLAGLERKYPHIDATHLADIVNGTNYCGDE